MRRALINDLNTHNIRCTILGGEWGNPAGGQLTGVKMESNGHSGPCQTFISTHSLDTDNDKTVHYTPSMFVEEVREI